MKAAVISAVGKTPEFGEFAEPVVGEGEVLVQVSAAGLHPIVRALASGEHYGSDGDYPMVPGVDGVGRLADGTRVYFGGVRSPFGTMAPVAAAPHGMCVPLPEALDDVTAAAIMNPGLAAWLALTWRANLQAGETVLVLGATGVSGRLAVQLARRLGAGRIIAAGRDAAALDRLGVDATVQLGGTDDAAAMSAAAGDVGIHVIVDYLWGAPAEAAITAISRRGMTHGAPRVRLVEVGQSAGPSITLRADVLRSSGLEILGSGVGTVPLADLRKAVPEFLRITASGELSIDIDEVALSDVAAAWRQRSGDGRRTVLLP
ncbi:quinone oxidoreductase family protein [Streptomyces sp. YIM S03343]